MSLRFGPPGADTALVCIDMQRMFLEPGPWFCPEGLRILPACAALAAAAGERALFTRFVPAERPEAAEGAWRRYYRRWPEVTLEAAGAHTVALHADLAPLAGAGRVFDKTGYDAFGSAAFRDAVLTRRPGALALCGVETDVCVLATALSAVDLGLRVIVVEDAVASAETAGHRAALDAVYPRFDAQIEICDSAELLGVWRAS
jgi:nicotinamidase-related amidase